MKLKENKPFKIIPLLNQVTLVKVKWQAKPVAKQLWNLEDPFILNQLNHISLDPFTCF